MKLSKKWTTVTPVSKAIAMALFVLLPFIGFYLGVKYETVFSVSKSNTSDLIRGQLEHYQNEQMGYSFSYTLDNQLYQVACQIPFTSSETQEVFRLFKKEGFLGCNSGIPVIEILSGQAFDCESSQFYKAVESEITVAGAKSPRCTNNVIKAVQGTS